MTYVNGTGIETREVADDANVLITISSSEAEGMIRRWGMVAHAIGDLSVEAVVRGAVDDRVVSLLREQRPQQYQNERELTERLRLILDSGYRMFARDTDDPIDAARAGKVAARSLLACGHPEYQCTSFYVLHLTVEPFGAAALAARHDERGTADASDALSRDMAAADARPEVAATSPAADIEPALSADQADTWQPAASPVEPATCVGYHAAEAAAAPVQPADGYLEPDAATEPASTGTDETSERWQESPAAAPEPVALAAVTEAEPDLDGLLAEPEPAVTETVGPQPKKYARKADALMDQFRPKIEALDFRGLFVGNFGYQRDTVVDVAKLSALSPQTVSAYLMKANSLRQSGDHEKALSYYRVLLKSDPDNADYRFLYGKALLEMGRIEPARECLERARELGHENAAHELTELEHRQAKKPPLAFLQFWRHAESPR